MSRWPKPAEGSWTEHYPELGTAPVSYEDSISPEFYELEREAIFKRAWLNVGRVEQLARTGATSPRSSPSRGHRSSSCATRTARSAPSTTSAGTGATSWCGTTSRARRRAAPAASSSASTTAGATTSTAPARSCSRRRSSSTSTRRTTASSPCTATCGRASSSSTSPSEPSQSLREFLGPMIDRARGLSVRQADRALLLPRRCRSNWKLFMDAFQEFYHAPVLHAGSHRRTRRPRLRGRFRGTALRDRRSAPAGHDVRAAGASGSRREMPQAHGARDPQRSVRPVGRARPRRRQLPRRHQPGAVRRRGASTRSRSGRTS